MLCAQGCIWCDLKKGTIGCRYILDNRVNPFEFKNVSVSLGVMSEMQHIFPTEQETVITQRYTSFALE